ncbi:aminotransferase class I/II-fold pyridoxal phosphate-dependent enzyme [Afifella sp. H1R]|uniref:aminotransferase class I/II-fold pyridoxal phosphate-dependent enzyme n=1 Tax=Afifella sp. H1R TaxID=2908841 RepID=UPI001F44272A|nr:aminotransferase class I/II-fold pyridoxal phosphate-dependent enzyme [Afifella sp. H1R]MCF1503052.1 aminotransferase class I/II-fold pyridoxal phosphate-dependent enzyme [Afifella sp. H1R]
MYHGGDPAAAGALYGIFRDDWLDLSTGINPRAWPWRERVNLDEVALERLPSRGDLNSVMAAARDTYRVPEDAEILPVAGIEPVIRQLPSLIRKAVLLDTSYASYRTAFDNQIPVIRAPSEIPARTSVILVNPNNPDGRVLSPETILSLAESRQDADLVVVDEAYEDALTERTSVIPFMSRMQNLVVLRSFGKFYGLPGLRLGFIIAHAQLIAPLRERLGDWPVSQLAITLGRQALADREWQEKTRLSLDTQARELRALLVAHGLQFESQSPLLALIRDDRVAEMHRGLAARGIWTRIFTDRPDSLRLGLPGDESEFRRLEVAFNEILPS